MGETTVQRRRWGSWTGVPSHHEGADDDCGECVEWDLLWVGPNDAGVIKTIVFSLQATSEP